MYIMSININPVNKMLRTFIFGFMKLHTMYKVLLSLILVVSLLIAISFWSESNIQYARKCFTASSYRNQDLDVISLNDVMEDERKPQFGKTIFFHETSCSDGIIRLNARQACAIESAAKSNPSWDVFVLFASPGGLLNNTFDPIITALEKYPNIFMRNVNLWTYAYDTPMEQWIRDEVLFHSKYINSHASDFLRYLSLYKWGGTYLDLDVILKKNLDQIPSNYAGAESENFVAAGILNFDYDGAGHKIALSCLREFQTNFDGRDWGNNGPGVITRVLHRVCQTTYPPFMTRERCQSFNVYPISSFYAIGWRDWRYFFDEKFTKRALQMTNNSIAIHVWNKHSVRHRIRVGSNVAYGLLAAEYCPTVYKSCGEYF